MALAQVCAWHYGLTPFDVFDPKQIDSLRPGDLLSRRAMPGVASWIRNTVGMMHFGCIIGVPKKETETEIELEREIAGCLSPEMLKERLIQEAERKMMAIRMVHYVKDKKRKLCKVIETNMLYFIFEKLSYRNVKNRSEALTVYILPPPPEAEEGENSKFRETVVERAKASIGMRDYSVMFRNCEHWAQKVLYNKEWDEVQSIQIQVAAFVVVLLALFIVLLVWRRNKSRSSFSTRRQSLQ